MNSTFAATSTEHSPTRALLLLPTRSPSWSAGRKRRQHLQRLEDRHFVVLGSDGEISMALPFAARPTGHRVLNGSRSWWANCAWDSLAIPAALHADAEIEARWLDDDTPVDLRIENGRPTGEACDGFIHFTIPARHWWDDIVET